MMLNTIVKMGNEDINDLNFKKKFNNFVNSKVIAEDGCSKLVN
jgi:hypothetical protein